MATENVKQAAQELIANLPEDASWEDLMYQIYVRQSIEPGLRDSDADRTFSVKDVRKKFGLSS